MTREEIEAARAATTTTRFTLGWWIKRFAWIGVVALIHAINNAS